VSKRSYRRLAAVTGAALALGAMAPAMAAHVAGDGAASASVNTIDVTDVTPALAPAGVAANGVGILTGSLVSTAFSAPFMALSDAHDVVGDAAGIATGLLGGNITAGLTGAAAASLGGVAVSAAGLVNAPLNVVGTLGDSGLLGDTLGTVQDVRGVATGLVSTAGGVAFSTVGSVAGVPAGVPAILSAVLGTSAAANVNLLAGVGGIL